MKNKTYPLHQLFICFAVLLISGCGVFTKTHYGNGLKFNGESGLFSKQQDDSFYLKRYYAKKKLKRIGNGIVEQDVSLIGIDSTHLNHVDTGYSSLVNLKPTLEDNSKGVKQKIESRPTEIIEHTADSTKPITGIKDIGYDQNAKAAGWLFYGGMVLRLAVLFLVSLNPIFYLIYILLSLVMLAGFVFAIISLVRIKDEKSRGNYLRGRGLSLSIIILFAISILLTILTIALYIAILAAIF